MAGHEDKRSHSVANIAFDAVVDWITRYRRSLKFNSELETIDPDQVADKAQCSFDLSIGSGHISQFLPERYGAR